MNHLPQFHCFIFLCFVVAHWVSLKQQFWIHNQLNRKMLCLCIQLLEIYCFLLVIACFLDSWHSLEFVLLFSHWNQQTLPRVFLYLSSSSRIYFLLVLLMSGIFSNLVWISLFYMSYSFSWQYSYAYVLSSSSNSSDWLLETSFVFSDSGTISAPCCATLRQGHHWQSFSYLYNVS